LIDIRQSRKTDLPRILAIERVSFAGEAWDKEIFLEYFACCPDLFVVAKAGRRIAGYAITCIAGERAELVSIAVDPDYREHGTGAAMMKHMARRLRRRRVADWWLMVRITNETAVRFYKRLGFVRTRTVRNYYEDGGAAWRMRLKFVGIGAHHPSDPG
jgi:[ribosomal protein S18]-alanine N-acetyltransferase